MKWKSIFQYMKIIAYKVLKPLYKKFQFNNFVEKNNEN